MYQEIFNNVTSIKAVDGGFELNDNRFILNSDGGDKMFKVSLGTGTAYLAVFYVDAQNEQDAVDRVVDFCEDNDYSGYYSEYSDLEDEADREEVDVEQYIEECGLTSAGNSSHYVDLQGVEEIR